MDNIAINQDDTATMRDNIAATGDNTATMRENIINNYIDENGAVEISIEKWDELVKIHTKEALVQSLINSIQKGHIENSSSSSHDKKNSSSSSHDKKNSSPVHVHQTISYPYLKLYYSLQSIQEKFQDLKIFKAEFTNRFDIDWSQYQVHKKTKFITSILPANPLCFIQDRNYYEKYNLLSDYFQEEHRVLAKRHNMQYSPYEYWNCAKNTKSLIEWCIEHFKCVSVKGLRSAMYRGPTGECINFKVTVGVGLMQNLQSKRILDFCSGWGDRLLSALACNADIYCGVDPNPLVHIGYKKAMNLFASEDQKSKYNFIQDGFIECKLPENQTYDLVFTSPPYFDLEVYSVQDEKQSIQKHPTLFQWMTGFLLPSLQKAWSVLEKGKYMVISINDFRKNKQWIAYTEIMILFIQAVLPGAHFVSCVGYGYDDVSSEADENDEKRGEQKKTSKNKMIGFRPLWVFQKLEKETDKTKNNRIWCSKLLRIHYREYWEIYLKAFHKDLHKNPLNTAIAGSKRKLSENEITRSPMNKRH